VEYCFAVSANHIGNAAELKGIQEVVTLLVFVGFTAISFRQPLTPIQGAGFALIALGAVLVFRWEAGLSVLTTLPPDGAAPGGK
jgi:uncharacterized protein (DUF486 family)